MSNRNRKPQTKFKIGDKEYNISQTEHEDKQEWRKNLVLVSALPERMIGIIDDPSAIDERRPFRLFATLIYIAELTFTPVVEMQETDKGPQPVMRNGKPSIIGVQGGTKLHALIPYDFIGTPTVNVSTYQYAIRIADQEESFQKWVYNEYLNFFDPPQVERIIK